MEEHQIGWIAAIIIGGIAGWLAEQFMKSQMGVLMNIVKARPNGISIGSPGPGTTPHRDEGIRQAVAARELAAPGSRARSGCEASRNRKNFAVIYSSSVRLSTSRSTT
jgi:hypothetical protein